MVYMSIFAVCDNFLMCLETIYWPDLMVVCCSRIASLYAGDMKSLGTDYGKGSARMQVAPRSVQRPR